MGALIPAACGPPLAEGPAGSVGAPWAAGGPGLREAVLGACVTVRPRLWTPLGEWGDSAAQGSQPETRWIPAPQLCFPPSQGYPRVISPSLQLQIPPQSCSQT